MYYYYSLSTKFPAFCQFQYANVFAQLQIMLSASAKARASRELPKRFVTNELRIRENAALAGIHLLPEIHFAASSASHFLQYMYI